MEHWYRDPGIYINFYRVRAWQPNQHHWTGPPTCKSFVYCLRVHNLVFPSFYTCCHSLRCKHLSFINLLLHHYAQVTWTNLVNFILSQQLMISCQMHVVPLQWPSSLNYSCIQLVITFKNLRLVCIAHSRAKITFMQKMIWLP